MSPSDNETREEEYFCDIRGREMLAYSCELVRPNCGYCRDCTDP
jgi:hypothetical protein